MALNASTTSLVDLAEHFRVPVALPSSRMSSNWWTAASDGDLDRMQELLAAGEVTDVNVGDEQGYTALHAAASYAHEGVLQMLLSQGANVEVCDADGDRPIHYCETPFAAETLVAAGAQVDAQNGEGETVMDKAVEDGYEELVAYLTTLPAFADVNPAALAESQQEQQAASATGEEGDMAAAASEFVGDTVVTEDGVMHLTVEQLRSLVEGTADADEGEGEEEEQQQHQEEEEEEEDMLAAQMEADDDDTAPTAAANL